MGAFLKVLRPFALFFALLGWLLGAGMARYLGGGVSWGPFAFGLAVVLALLPSAFWMAEAFRLPFTPLDAGETPRQRLRLQERLLSASYISLALAFVCTLTLLMMGQLEPASGVLTGMGFLFVVGYAVPPFRACDRGYGEFLLAFYLTILVPTLSFFLQTGDFHRLLPIVSFPLMLLALAWLLVEDFPTFAHDQRLGRQTLLTRLTWPRAIPLHHLLVILAFLLFGLAPPLGVSWALVWPVFLIAPLAGVQVFWLHRIGQGGRTLWKFLLPLAAGTFGLPLYLLTLAFWLR
ncbi:MAG: UbiA family prenyltransferase [Anaerolineales bacterium]